MIFAQGLLVALQNASPKSLVVVFTDNGSKDLMLERDIVRLRKTKEIEVESFPTLVTSIPARILVLAILTSPRCSSC